MLFFLCMLQKAPKEVSGGDYAVPSTEGSLRSGWWGRVQLSGYVFPSVTADPKTSCGSPAPPRTNLWFRTDTGGRAALLIPHHCSLGC